MAEARLYRAGRKEVFPVEEDSGEGGKRDLEDAGQVWCGGN